MTGTARLWSVATGRRLARLQDASAAAVGPIAFARGGQLLMSLENTAEVTEWNLGADGPAVAG
jgi:hypothetical protein